MKKKIIEEKIWLQEKQREKGSRERDKIYPFDGDGKDKVKSCPSIVKQKVFRKNVDSGNISREKER